MRAVQLLVLIIVACVGAWATSQHRQIIRELDVRYGNSDSNVIGPFDSALGRDIPETFELPQHPIGPSELQDNPYIK